MLKRYSSYKKLSADLLLAASSGKFKTISFDVFDTLIHRRIAPELVLDGVCHAFRDLLLKQGLPLPKRPLLDYRRDVYISLAKQNAAAGLDPDTTLDELAPAWVAAVIDVDPGQPIVKTLGQHLAAAEIALERRVCYANPWLTEVLPELKYLGITIHAISDMYLGKNHVGTILNDHGLLPLLNELHVSGDQRRLKRTGRLFAYVKENHGIDPTDWLHIGDDFEADGLMAQRHKITAWVINDKVIHNESRMHSFDATLLAQDPTWAGNIISNYGSAIDTPKISAEQMFGQRIAGPILCTFIHRVLERCHEEKISRVYFLAREGHLLKQIYHRLALLVFPAGDAPQPVYLAISRLSALLGAMHRFGPNELAAAMDNCGHHSLRNLLAPLQIDAFSLEQLARRYDITNIDTPLTPPIADNPTLLRLLDDPNLIAHAEALGNNTRRDLHAYLRQSGWFNQDRIAVVDLGWGGQIQDSLHRSLNTVTKKPTIFGLYLGTNLRATQRQRDDNRFEGLLADERQPNWSSSASFEFVFALEAVCRAPHGTTLGYKETTDGTIVPCFKDDNDPSRQSEINDENFIALLQHGVLNQATKYAECADILRIKGTQCVPYARTLIERMIRYPSRDEIRWWSRLSNVADLGSTHTMNLGHNGPGLSLFSLKTAIRSSAFHYGLAGQTAGRIGQIALSIAKGLVRLQNVSPQLPSTERSSIPFESGNISNPRTPIPDWEHEIDIRFATILTQAKGRPCEQAKLRIAGLSAQELAPIALGHTVTYLLATLIGKNLPPRDIPAWWTMIQRNMFARANLKKRLVLLRRILWRLHQ